MQPDLEHRTPTPSRRRTRWLLAIGLVVLAPFCAEYAIGYDTSTGDLAEMLGGVLIFGPLYGAPALLIREIARRRDIRWHGVLALAAAFGILQAGVIDQSMFNSSYRDIEYWSELVQPTMIGPLGFAAYPAMLFVVGHIVWSFAVPIVLVESLRPELATRPWLGRPGMVITVGLYLAAAAAVLFDTQRTEDEAASTAQIVGALLVAALAVPYALTVGRRQRGTARSATTPGPVVVGILSLVAALAYGALPPSWLGFAVGIAILAGSAFAIARFARSPQWDARHLVAIATGALVARAAYGFLIEPLGDVEPFAQYAHNTAFVLGALLLGIVGARRNRSVPASV